MVLAIDIGNTNVVIGCFQEKEILFVERVSTNQNATPLELAVSIKTILEIYRIQTEEIEGSIISSVVPSINNSLRGSKTMFSRSPLTIRHSWAATVWRMLWQPCTSTNRPSSSLTWALLLHSPSSMPGGGISAA